MGTNATIPRDDIVYGFGQHLVFDGYKGSFATLDNMDEIFKFLDTLPGIIGMTKITCPYVIRYNAPIKEDSGITGFVIIAESHISVHTFPFKRYVSIDVFSCKEFNVDLAVEYILRTFQVEQYESKVTKRGLKFPRGPVSLI